MGTVTQVCAHVARRPGGDLTRIEGASLAPCPWCELNRLRTVAAKALHEMTHTIAPRTSFTDVVNELDEALCTTDSASSANTENNNGS